mmetsp:Transcript_11073/g.11091  ORF Transcript_11073/g.11091 Transcript_11073/m.11091 type:complete len:208 (-) Transcript_11073:246-869(-)
MLFCCNDINKDCNSVNLLSNIITYSCCRITFSLISVRAVVILSDSIFISDRLFSEFFNLLYSISRVVIFNLYLSNNSNARFFSGNISAVVISNSLLNTVTRPSAAVNRAFNRSTSALSLCKENVNSSDLFSRELRRIDFVLYSEEAVISSSLISTYAFVNWATARCAEFNLFCSADEIFSCCNFIVMVSFSLARADSNLLVFFKISD